MWGVLPNIFVLTLSNEEWSTDLNLHTESCSLN